jgi:hypothetical protein
MDAVLTSDWFGSLVGGLNGNVAALAWFAGAILLLDLFDVDLPRGDSVGVAGAVCAAAIAAFSPWWAGVAVLLSALLASVLRLRRFRPRHLVTLVLSRGAALTTSSIGWLLARSERADALVDILLPAVFLLTEFAVAQTVSAVWTRRPLPRQLRGNMGAQAPLLAAQWSVSVLLLITYGSMSAWSLIPAVALLLLMRQSYALYLNIRETYRTTVEVLVQAAEGQDERRLGHAERTAVIARAIAMKAGLSAQEVERVSFAALLHDVGELAEQTSAEAEDPVTRASAASVVQGVEYFAKVGPVLEVCDGVNESAPEADDLRAALIVALASDIDAEYYPEVADAHCGSALETVLPIAGAAVKAKIVGTALGLGYKVPAVG